MRSGPDVDADAVLDPESSAVVERLRLEYRQRPVDRNVALHVAEIQKAAQAQPADHFLDRSILVRVAAVAVVVAVGSIAFMVAVARSAPTNLQADLASDGFRTGEPASGEDLTDERRDLIGADRIAGGIDGRSSSPDADDTVGDAGPVPSSADDQPAATSTPTVDVDDSKGLGLSAPVTDSPTPTTPRTSSGQPQPTATTSTASGQPPSSQARSTASFAPAPSVTAPPSAPALKSSTTSGMTCNGRPATIVGTNSADVLKGTPGPDVIYGGSGNDVIYGLGGNDTICGGNGKDDLDGGPGDDYLNGGNGKDRLVGGDGVDVLDGGNGKDEMIPDHP